MGFAAGVLSVKGARELVIGAFQSERPAAVTRPRTVSRPAFEFEHAGNWAVDVKDRDYDPDHMFSVDTPGQSFIMFVIVDGELSPGEAVRQHAAAQTSKVMRGASQSPFTRWGAHTGEGLLLTGKQLGVAPGTIRIFAFREQDRTFTVVESTFDEDRANVQPGFDLIERTFQVRGP